MGKSLITKPATRAVDAAWAQIDAERKLQQIRILLETAQDNLEGDNFDHDFVLGCVSSALLVAVGKKAAEWQVKKDKLRSATK